MEKHGENQDDTQVKPRAQEEFLIASNVSAALGPLVHTMAAFGSMNLVQSLDAAQDIHMSALGSELKAQGVEIIEMIQPQRSFSAQRENFSEPPPVMVVQMTSEQAAALKRAKGNQISIAPNLPVGFVEIGLSPSFFDERGLNIGRTQQGPLSVDVKVVGNGNPLPDAEVTVFGSTSTARGITDRSGNLSLSLTNETNDTLRGILVQPAGGFWNRLIRSPEIDTSGVNTVVLQPLSKSFPGFPGSQLLGGGRRRWEWRRFLNNIKGEECASR